MKKLVTLSVSIIGALSLYAGVASAHVTVQPKETSQGKYEVFTVRVPSESEEVPTTKVEVKFSEEVNITRFEPKPGWTYEVQKDTSGKITSVTWTTEGEGLSPTEFGQFNMQGKVGDDANEIVWKAYQTYKDGSVVEWVGAEDAEHPASVTVVNQAVASDHGATHADQSANSDSAQQAVDENTKTNESKTPLYLSIAALIVGLLAFGVSIFKKK
ncbi:YcnI family protein [Bacillus sp. CGMCC 1.16607]|uniref:YcnI family copper-binding membrane protein n=1 Tax=Bacillus sp. CGMCC 1.16607 TaxID=3351842 RepID=UPI0036448ACF